MDEGLNLNQLVIGAIAALATGAVGWIFGGKATAKSAEASANESMSRAYGATIGDLANRLAAVEKSLELSWRREELLVKALRANGIAIPPLPLELDEHPAGN